MKEKNLFHSTLSHSSKNNLPNTNPKRIFGKGYGESQLKVNCPCDGEIISTCSDEEHQQNRRTEFVIIKM